MFHSPRFLKVKSGSNVVLPDHSAYDPGEIHTPFNWIVADAAARNALTPVAADVYKTLYETSTGIVYLLLNHSPVTWEALSTPSIEYGPAFQASHSTGQNVASGQITLVASNETYDTHSRYDTTTGKFTADRDGYYNFAGYAFANDTGQWPAQARLLLVRTRSGTPATVWAGSNLPMVAADEKVLHFSAQLQLLSGDTVELQADTTGVNNITARWAGHFVRPLANIVINSLRAADVVGPAFYATRSTDKAISALTTTVIECDAEQYDTDSLHNTSTGQFVCNKPGFYRFHGFARCNNGFPAEAQLALRRTRSGVFYTFWQSVSLGSLSGLKALTTSGEIDLIAGDVVELTFFCNSALTVNPTIRFAGSFVRPPQNYIASGDSSNVTQLSKTGTQSIANTTWTTITWSAEVFDEANAANLGSSSSRITVPAGFTKMRLKANGHFASTATASIRGLRFLKNGAALILGAELKNNPLSNIATVNINTPWLPVAAGDYFEVQAYHSEGAALNFNSNETLYPCAFEAEFR